MFRRCVMNVIVALILLQTAWVKSGSLLSFWCVVPVASLCRFLPSAVFGRETILHLFELGELASSIAVDLRLRAISGFLVAAGVKMLGL